MPPVAPTEGSPVEVEFKTKEGEVTTELNAPVAPETLPVSGPVKEAAPTAPEKFPVEPETWPSAEVWELMELVVRSPERVAEGPVRGPDRVVAPAARFPVTAAEPAASCPVTVAVPPARPPGTEKLGRSLVKAERPAGLCLM